MHVTPKQRARFPQKLKRDPSGCLLWTGGRTSTGYGQMSIGTTLDGSVRTVKAHRLAHYLATGEEPPVVRHKCDTPLCCNPEHLEGGTQADNIKDLWSRGRQNTPDRRGPRNGNAKLSAKDVQDIRSRIRAGEGTMRIAKDYPVAPSTISKIRNGDTHRDPLV